MESAYSLFEAGEPCEIMSVLAISCAWVEDWGCTIRIRSPYLPIGIIHLRGRTTLVDRLPEQFKCEPLTQDECESLPT